MIPFHPTTAQTRISPPATTCSLVPEACPERSRRVPVLLTTDHCSLPSVFPAHNSPMIDQQKTREQAIDKQTRIAPLPATAYWLLAIGHWLFLAPSPLVFPIPRSQATVHDPRSTAPGLSGLCFSRSLAPCFSVPSLLRLSNHQPLLTNHCFYPPPHTQSTHPPGIEQTHPPMPFCETVKL
jgi:hypothetical protein